MCGARAGERQGQARAASGVGVGHVALPSGNNGRFRGAARRVGAPQWRRDGASWHARQEAMSGSAARRVGGVDERRRQATLLQPFVNGVRELGCARLSSSVCRGVAVGVQQASVRHQQALGDGGSSSLPAQAQVALPCLPWQ